MGVLNTVNAVLLLWTVIAGHTGTLIDAAIEWEFEMHDTKNELFDASERGDVAEVRQLLGDNCTDVDNPHGFHSERHDKWVATSLHIAAENNHTQVVMLLLSCGADPNIQTTEGETPLMLASRWGTVDVVHVLLGANADTDITDVPDNLTALMSATGNIKKVKALISAGANLDLKRYGGYTALMLESHYNHLDVVKALISAGAKVDLTDDYGWSALMMASRYADVDVVNVLLAAHADVDIQGSSFRSYERTYNKGLMYGYTALMLASENNRLDVVKALISAGAQVNLQSTANITEEVAKELISAGAEVDSSIATGYTALMLASSSGHLDVVKVLLSAGAEADQQMYTGETALMLAVLEEHSDVTTALAESGANMSMKNNVANTALHIAAEKDRAEEIKTLLKHGADANIKSMWGENAEDIARRNGFTYILKLIRQSTVCSNLYH